jgi:hypothetical protein
MSLDELRARLQRIEDSTKEIAEIKAYLMELKGTGHEHSPGTIGWLVTQVKWLVDQVDRIGKVLSTHGGYFTLLRNGKPLPASAWNDPPRESVDIGTSAGQWFHYDALKMLAAAAIGGGVVVLLMGGAVLIILTRWFGVTL